MSDSQEFFENLDPDSDHNTDDRPAEDDTQPTRPFDDEIPANIGRYKIIRLLGKGGFGVVYLAYDPDLRREVALKIPHKKLAEHDDFCQRFREEGQMLAKINHVGVVTVYDVGTHDELPFVVMEYVGGKNLSQILKKSLIKHDQVVEILIEIATALRETHKVDIVHRDLKPGNVIIDKQGRAVVVDFGLALHDDSLVQENRLILGTRRYMAPEQIRGENHRTHGQTDIWAFGVTMYRMLTGKLPFDSESDSELYQKICYQDPRPLRQRNDKIDRELERICLKCLGKLISDRYQSMADLLEDLQAFQLGKTADQDDELPRRGRKATTKDSEPVSDTTPSALTTGHSAPVKIVPKGLRCFDNNDAEFFLQLLPGPKDRYGLPDSIRFWKSRAETDHESESFSVGLIFGPSGCGKSSFVRAGLIPVLDKRIIPIYVECTSDQTERQIVDQLAYHFANIEADADLAKLMLDIRCGRILNPGDKLLIVLDQFEQWLSLRENFEDEPLVDALRQCDSQRAQVILSCRDDFYLSANQFMRWIEIPIQDGVNAMALPLFDRRHARKVLTAFGRANEDLPAGDQPLNNQQKQFVKQAVELLVDRNRVICVQLAVLSEMMKQRQWTMAELRRLGGIEGVGVRYLDETFHGAEVPSAYAEYAEPARQILSLMLPTSATSIKGIGQTREQLADRLGDQTSRPEFDNVFNFLVDDAKLVSPIELPSAKELSESEPLESDQEKSSSYYHLAHDFLVNPIREWTQRREKETWRGRARIRFEELASRWNESEDDKFLPSFSEYPRFLVGVPQTARKSRHPNFWKRSSKQFSITLAIILMFLSTLIGGSLYAYHGYHQRQAELLANQALGCDSEAFPFVLDAAKKYRKRIRKYFKGYQAENSLSHFRKDLMFIEFGFLDEVDQRETLRHYLSVSESETENLLRRYFRSQNNHDLHEALEGLFGDLTHSSSASNSVDQEQIRQQKSRLAVVSLFTGYGKLTNQFVNSKDRSQLTVFVDTLTKCRLSTDILSDPLDQEDENPNTVFAILSSIHMSDLTHDQRRRILPRIQALMESESDTGILSICFTLANRINGKSNANELAGAHSVVCDHDSMFVKIDLKNNRAILVSTLEVSRGELDSFIKFRHDLFKCMFGIETVPSYSQTTISPSMDHPAQNVSFDLALQFCNYRSEIGGLSPCYTKLKDEWFFDRSANGFRLPITEEFMTFSDAQPNGKCPLGSTNMYTFFADYYCYSQNSIYGDVPIQRAMVGGSLLPNRYGLFDSIGNVGEWIWVGKETPTPTELQAFEPKRGFPYIGGDFRSTPDKLFPIAKQSFVLRTGNAKIGFRLVRNSTN